jgi:hypothetical protein
MIKKWLEERNRRKWFKEMDLKLITERQKELLNQMLFHAMVEIRNLCWGGQTEQAAALSDAFHELPSVMYSEQFSFSWFRKSLEAYQTKHRTLDDKREYDYTKMLDKAMREEDL